MDDINILLYNEEWNEAIQGLTSGTKLDDIDFEHVFQWRIYCILENDVEQRKLIDKFIHLSINLGFIPANIFQAASISSQSHIERLLNEGHDINAPGGTRDLTGLHVAVIQKEKELVELFMNHNADNDVVDTDDNKPIDFAEEGSEIFKILKRSGVKTKAEIEESLQDYYDAVSYINDFRDTQIEFMRGAEEGNLARMERALSRPNGRFVLKESWPVNGKTALHLATENNRIEAVRFLIEKGLDINRPDRKGETPLDIVKQLNLIEIMELMNRISD
jgi:ankyrin repeat protein